MPDDVAAGPAPPPGENGDRSNELATIRRILVGPERQRIEQLEAELESKHLTAAELAEHLPEAIALRGARDRQIGRALAPAVETALRESIHRNPRDIATAIFPVLGPAIRKAIAETMAALVRSINSAVEHSLTPQGIRWRLEAWQTGVPYAQVVIRHALVYRVEQAFLIHAETGLLLEHATAPGLDVPDADLISGMLTAIQDFVRDSFRPGEGAMLRTFTVGEHTVQVEAGPLALLALVIRGQAPESVLRRQQDVLETIHVQFGSQLEEFSGDAGPMHGAHPLLEECLVTVVDTASGRRARLAWMGWAVPAAVFLVAGVVLFARARSRFERAVAALDAEPGIVVVAASRSLNGWHVSGLRDPNARQPQQILAGAGLDPRRLDARWEPYVSLDSAIVVARARRALELPSTTATALTGDTLRISGDLPLPSLGRIAAGTQVPGVAAFDPSAARPVLSADLDSLRRVIESERILFASGSADLSPPAAVLARLVARQFAELAAGAVANGAAVHLALTGRTDTTGTNEANQALAQWRVDRVASVLAAAGLPTDNVLHEAVATTRPLSAATVEETSRINRSVSFGITVSTGRPPGRRE